MKNRDLYCLVTHERSGVVREALNAHHGVRAFSCDLEPAEDGRHDVHIHGDAVTAMRSRRWDFIGMHPECRYINGAGLHWNNRGRGWDKTNAALQHIADCRDAAGDTPHYLESSIGILSTRWRKPDQIVQPYDFGADASKATCLWLHRLPVLRITGPRVDPRWVCPSCKLVSTHEAASAWRDRAGKPRCHRCSGLPALRPRWRNQTDSGQNKLAPSETRSMDRARTYPGIAAAIASQFIKHLLAQ